MLPHMPDGVVQISNSDMTPSGTMGPFTFSCWIGGEKFSGHGRTPSEAAEDLKTATSGRVRIVVNNYTSRDALRDLVKKLNDSLPDVEAVFPKLQREQVSSYPGSGHYGSKRKKGKFRK